MPNLTRPSDDHSLSQIEYALTRQVPDMNRGVIIHTTYGDLELLEHDAVLISRVVQSILERQRDELISSGGE